MEIDRKQIKEEYFKDESLFARKILLVINMFSIIIWFISIVMVLKKAKRKTFMFYTTIILGFSTLALFLYRFYYHLSHTSIIDLHLGADYRVCQTGPDGVSDKEIKNGAIGFIDWDCSIKSWFRMTDVGNGYRTGAYYITYTMFALVLTHLKLVGKTDEYLTAVIRWLLLFGILTITASRYCTQWILSVFSISLASDFTIMMTIMAILVLIKIINSMAQR